MLQQKAPQERKPPKDFGSIVPRCFQVVCPFAVAWKTATLESRENKAGELWGFPKLKQNCISLKCAHTLTHTQHTGVVGYMNSHITG